MDQTLFSFMCVLLLTCATNIGAQQAISATYKSETALVLVPVAVTNIRGETVNGLNKNRFQILEDRVAQGIVSFSEEDSPAVAGVVLDISGSMSSSLTTAKMLLRTLVDVADAGDESFLFTVSDRPVKVSGVTTDLQSLPASLLMTRAAGNTSLVDTVFTALKEFHSTHLARRGLIVISDGMDNHSRHTKSELMSAAVEANVQIFSICLYNPPSGAKAISLHQVQEGVQFLRQLSDTTGGASFVTHDSHQEKESVETIEHLLHNEYVIGYMPQRQVADSATRDGRWHAIRVKLNVPGLTIHARPGYYSE